MKMRKVWLAMCSLMSMLFCASVLPAQSFSDAPVKKAETTTVADSKYYTDAKDLATEDPDFIVYLTAGSYNTYSRSYSVTIMDESGYADFLLGYYGEGENYLPLTASYYLLDKENNNEKVRFETTIGATQNASHPLYNGVGLGLGHTEFVFDLDLMFDDRYEVDPDSDFELYNIFEAKRDENNNVVPDKENFYKATKLSKSRKYKPADLTEYFKCKMLSVNTFGSYVTFDVEYYDDMVTLYKEKMTIADDNKANLEAGNAEYATQLSGFATTSTFLFEYKDGKKVSKNVSENTISSGQKFYQKEAELETKRNFQVNYLIENVETKDLVNVSLCGVTLNVMIYNISSTGTLTLANLTTYSARLGCIRFARDNDEPVYQAPTTNIILVLVIASLIYIAVACAGIAALFFYRKNKYKNDEFRRVNPRRFFKTAGLAFAGLWALLLDIIFIVTRGGIFNNVLTSFNPLDNYIVVLSIAIIFFAGYFIKFGVNAFKDGRTRRQAIRLGLNEKSDSNDGTK